MSFAVQTSYSQTYQYGRYNSKPGYTDTAFDTEFMGKATSRTTSSSDGKNIGIMTTGNRGFIAEYADSSTEKDPIIKVGGYEVRVNDVDPKNATEMCEEGVTQIIKFGIAFSGKRVKIRTE